MHKTSGHFSKVLYVVFEAMRKHFNCVWGSVHDMDERTTEDGIWIQPNLLKRKKMLLLYKNRFINKTHSDTSTISGFSSKECRFG